MTLRTRLALGLAIVVALGAIGFGVAARATVERALYEEVDRELANEVRRTVGNLDGRGGGLALDRNRPRGDSHGPFGRGGPGEFFGRGAIYAQVTSAGGEVLQRTSAVDAIGGLPEPRVDEGHEGVELRTVGIQGERYRLAEAVTPTGNRVQVARPLGEVANFLRTLRWVLVVAGLVALGAAVAFGRWAARATLRPVERMTRTARTIAESPRDLSTRVEPAFPDPELAEFAESMNGMLDAIQAADAQQRRFVADASHELRTPLTSLGGNASFLDRSTSLDEDGREALAAVRRDIDRLIRIADGLTTLARLDASPVHQVEPVDVDAVARDATARSRAVHGAHAFELVGSGGTQLLDGELVRRVFGNLLDNAGRYTPPGTRVRVEVAARAGELRIVVQDDGPGLPQQERVQALERFHRGSTSAGIPGTGLGLAIVAEAAEAFGGSLELGDVVPHGLRCEVRIPLAAGTHPAP